MIHVHFERDENGAVTSFTMSGHAESGPYGYDLVCAGASAVSFGAVNAVYELTGTKLDVGMESGGGYLSAAVPQGLPERVFSQVQLLLEGLLVSLKTIEDQYGEFIRVHS
ncbi:ribosomal-processing cysteine protease Prp [Bacillus daqingensis]|uniref:Ribosomal processing cysteine protease Prp n=1 Tax=Bacillus daqingensis TaxID=872396 RepID=A0ABV9NZF6_9BACI